MQIGVYLLKKIKVQKNLLTQVIQIKKKKMINQMIYQMMIKKIIMKKISEIKML